MLLLLSTLCAPLYAEPSASISGRVTDAASGAPVPSAVVNAVSLTDRRSAKTNAAGQYTIVGLAPDTYTVSFEARGYDGASVSGLTLLAGQSAEQNIRLTKQLRTIVRVKARLLNSPFDPNTTSVAYKINAQQIDQIQGKAFNQDENNLLRSLPSVTLDKSGTISIRGGFAFEAAYRYEGIDYTTPTPNLQNTLQNVSNFSLVNGLAGVELIPGAGDASHGNTGTGLVEFTAKRGSFPGFTGFDVETVSQPFHHQAGIEYGLATRNGAISNYISFLGQNQDYQYGKRGVPAALLGTRGTNAATLQSNVDPNLVYFSPSYQASRDFVDNFFVKFGRNRTQQLQFFFEGQAVKQDLDYGGFTGLSFPTAGSVAGLCSPLGVGSTVQQTVCNQLVPLYPTQQTAYQTVTQPDRLYSPFETFKFEYSTAIASETLVQARYFRTFTDERQELPQQGIFAADFGGDRSGVATDISHEFRSNHAKNLVSVGGEYQFVRPFGTELSFLKFGSYTFGPSAAANVGNLVSSFSNPPSIGAPGALTPDFFTPAECQAVNVYPFQNFVTSNPAIPGSKAYAPCGYLARYFSTIPRFPYLQLEPNTDEQVYGLYAQDKITLGKSGRLHVDPGVRYEGFNFLIPFDPTSPPEINGIKQQRQVEPHFGTTYQIGRRDDVRFNFGHTLSVPLPSLLGAAVSRQPYVAFASVPSFDNSTGAAARYCGINRSTLCTSYADQLYWLARNLQYGTQSQNVPLHGATFTNYDFSYEHQFSNDLALKLSPFYRRGYDIIEQAADPIALSPITGAPQYGNTFYTNGGLQRSTGIELQISREVDDGISALFGATYINQFGNQPPGAFLSSAGLAAGTLYHSPDLSPFQATLALTYKHAGLRINPVFYANVGYPYGAGNLIPAFCNGSASVVPNTNVISGQTYAPNYVDPQSPGTCNAPNIAATRGYPEPSGAGGLYSKPEFNADLTIEYSPSRAPGTFGVQILNVFDQVYNTPVFSSCYGAIEATGNAYGHAPCSFVSTYSQGPASNAFPGAPYQLYPNLPPISGRFYYELRL